MKPVKRAASPVWFTLLGLALASMVYVAWQLASLPELSFVLGPDMTVRAVRVDGEISTESQQFQRGDRLVSLQRQTMEELRDLRAVLPHVAAQAERAQPAPTSPVGEADKAPAPNLVPYQIVRPLHRFTLALQGQKVEPTSLPPGLEANDRLVEIDGRLLPGKVGLEGIRSVLASRPEALLGFERQNAVFEGQMKLGPSRLPMAAMTLFFAVIALMGWLWQKSHEGVHPTTPVFVGGAALCFAWIALLALHYQWVLGDYALASVVSVSLVLMRPLTIFARNRSASENLGGGTVALGIGVAVSLALVAALVSDSLSSPERVLQAAGMAAGLFILYEVIITSIDRDSDVRLGERGGYLAGVVLLGFFACVVTAFIEPVAFEEDRWRWFAVALPAVVLFGDIIACLHNHAHGGVAEVADRSARREALLGYLRELEAHIPQSRAMIVAFRPSGSVLFSPGLAGLETTPLDKALHDAMDILLHEGARIPLPDTVVWANHPMYGIAQTMRLKMALHLNRPAQGFETEDVSFVVLAEQIDSNGASETVAPVSALTLDLAQQSATAAVWSAAVVEALTAFSLQGSAAEDFWNTPTARITLRAPVPEDYEHRLAEMQRTMQVLREESTELFTQLQILRHHGHQGRPSLGQCERLLEPELLEGLGILLETGEPVVIGGDVGTGKAFAAWAGHLLSDLPPESFVVFDAAHVSREEARAQLLGPASEQTEDDELPGGLMRLAVGGSLLVRSAHLLPDELLLELCEWTGLQPIFLYLCFDDPLAEEQSVLDGRRPALVRALGERELILPGLGRRREIIPTVATYLLRQAARQRGMAVEGFTDTALGLLTRYSWPGQFVELQANIAAALACTEGPRVDVQDLSADVQAAARRQFA